MSPLVKKWVLVILSLAGITTGLVNEGLKPFLQVNWWSQTLALAVFFTFLFTRLKKRDQPGKPG
jgi:hypothetical protein